ncbi:DUF4301 family protein [Thermodesulfobacteriota bacterium]
MREPIFEPSDIKQIEEKGISLEKVRSQIDRLKKGIPHVRLVRPCTIGDGITVLSPGDLERLNTLYTQSVSAGRAMKFVPASGAATRMFKLLLGIYNRPAKRDGEGGTVNNTPGDDDGAFQNFIRGLEDFAFYEDLKRVMEKNGLNLKTLLSRKQYTPILEHILTETGLNLANLPKGLIKFHAYPGHTRTAFEEHLVEAATYTLDEQDVAAIHFTISPEQEQRIKEHFSAILKQDAFSDTKYGITFSVQKPSTDTLAVDLANMPFRDREGRLVFRPGGHGALLENLNDLQGDIVFIKNIDNVVPDRLKQHTYVYKRALGGYLIELQGKAFGYLRKLSSGAIDQQLMDGLQNFARDRLSFSLPAVLDEGPIEDKVRFFREKLNRPLRVCGMVRNVSEPGGGPFWVAQGDGAASLQIVESSQVNKNSAEQRAIWASSTHFNPVDLVCAMRDYLGRPFNLKNFIDPETGFISRKSKEGKELKALELPGLWNGSMANWNTVFIEVPEITFNPVKTVLDLLREQHQPE